MLEVLGVSAAVVDLFQIFTDLVGRGLRLEHVADALADAFGGPAQMGLQNLAHIHPRRNAQRI